MGFAEDITKLSEQVRKRSLTLLLIENTKLLSSFYKRAVAALARNLYIWGFIDSMPRLLYRWFGM